MSRLKILQYGHPLLFEKAADIKKVGNRERDLIAAMGETMYDAHGIGLAGPQVGVMERIFVVDVDHERSDDPKADFDSRRLQVFINPEIVWESEDDEPFEEGCLSIPNLQREIYRPSVIKVVARDENFEPFEVEADELLARVIQHENDHLNGVLFIDHLNKLSRAMIAGELSRIKKATMAELPSLPENPADYPVTL